MKRDYYEVLGVARDAGTQEIKRAYRKLARELHPDVNSTDPQCEEKFKEATEAYEVLCDSEKRRLYDAYGHDAFRRGAGADGGGFGGFGDFGDIFESFFGSGIFGGGGARRQGPVRGQDLAVELEIDLEEAAFGVKRDVTLEILDTCGECGGSGAADQSAVHTCQDCGGSGQVRVVRSTMLGQMVQSGPCARCGGRGRVIDDPCLGCRGQGRAYREQVLTVDVPAGISDGQRIRLNGRGAAGERGGPPGDLYVHVTITAHDYFKREGDNILYELDLTMVQAALGARLTVPTLDGEEEVEFVPGTQPGEVKVLKGRGVPHLRGMGRGDQKVLVNVLIPRDLSEQQKGLLRDLDACLEVGQYNRRSDGFLGKLKHIFTG
jgi:molecular chaperone DnaJ